MSSRPPELVGYELEADQLDDVLASFESGTLGRVAVLSEPYGQRNRLLDYVEERCDGSTKRIRYSPTASHHARFEWTDCDVLLLDDCHHLYSRRVGGFDVFDDFLEAVTAFDGLVVSSWNMFSWEYLEVFKQLNSVFPTKLSLGGLSREQTKEHLLAEYSGGLPEYVDDREVTAEPLVTSTEHRLRLLGNRTVTIPLPHVNWDEIERRRAMEDERDPEDVVFERITSLANGNPGVAQRIWEDSLRDGTVGLDTLQEAESDIGSEYDTLFLLQILLSKERTRVRELADVVDHPQLDRTLGHLARAEILTIDGDDAVLSPRALKRVAEALERRRVLW